MYISTQAVSGIDVSVLKALTNLIQMITNPSSTAPLTMDYFFVGRQSLIGAALQSLDNLFANLQIIRCHLDFILSLKLFFFDEKSYCGNKNMPMLIGV